MGSIYHIPVMLKEAVDFLSVKKDHWYIDCNLGGGGHSGEILKRGGKVVGIDLDIDSINYVAKKYHLNIELGGDFLVAKSPSLILVCNNFFYMGKIVTNLGIKKASGILFDLGVSSYQLERAERGFSFNLDAALDMRMGQNAKITAADLVNGLHESELIELFWKLGEERYSKRIARKIVEYRKYKKIETTNELAKIILSVHPRSSTDRTHPATRVFQALRIAVNDELNSLKEALPQALNILQPGGRIVVISFHSLEDRIVKNYFKNWANKGLVKILTKKPIEPSEEEITKNPRSRSGKLRAAEKI